MTHAEEPKKTKHLLPAMWKQSSVWHALLLGEMRLECDGSQQRTSFHYAGHTLKKVF